jgi:hypothetical protein
VSDALFERLVSLIHFWKEGENGCGPPLVPISRLSDIELNQIRSITGSRGERLFERDWTQFLSHELQYYVDDCFRDVVSPSDQDVLRAIDRHLRAAMVAKKALEWPRRSISEHMVFHSVAGHELGKARKYLIEAQSSFEKQRAELASEMQVPTRAKRGPQTRTHETKFLFSIVFCAYRCGVDLSLGTTKQGDTIGVKKPLYRLVRFLLHCAVRRIDTESGDLTELAAVARRKASRLLHVQPITMINRLQSIKRDVKKRIKPPPGTFKTI